MNCNHSNIFFFFQSNGAFRGVINYLEKVWELHLYYMPNYVIYQISLADAERNVHSPVIAAAKFYLHDIRLSRKENHPMIMILH